MAAKKKYFDISDNTPKIAIPDGHLRPVLEEALNRMNYPYPSGKAYSSKAAYKLKDGSEQDFYLIIQKPKDSTKYVKSDKEGRDNLIACVSGYDCIINTLNIKLGDNPEENYSKGLKRRGLEELADLDFRPSSMVIAIHKDIPINSLEEFHRICSNGTGIRILGTEFPFIAKDYIERQKLNVGEVRQTTGKTESLFYGIAEAIVDVVETGKSIEANNGKILGKVIERSTPRFIARIEALENGVGPFLTEFADALKQTIYGLRKDPEYRKYFRAKPLKLAGAGN